jgi:Spy/CpxP family protein refolding chaperone
MKTTLLKKGMALMFVLMLTTAFSVNNSYAQHCKKGGDGAGCKGGQGQRCGMGEGDVIPDLTKDQSDKIYTLHLNLMKECNALNNQINEKKAHLVTVTTGEKADVNEAGKTIDEMYLLKAELAKKKVAFKMGIRALLTDEQKVYYDMHVSKCCDGASCKGDGKDCKGGGKDCKGDGKGCKDGDKCGKGQGGGKCGQGNGEGKGCKGGNPDGDKNVGPYHPE